MPGQHDTQRITDDQPRRPGSQDFEFHRIAQRMRAQRADRGDDDGGGRRTDRDMRVLYFISAEQGQHRKQGRNHHEPAADPEQTRSKACDQPGNKQGNQRHEPKHCGMRQIETPERSSGSLPLTGGRACVSVDVPRWQDCGALHGVAQLQSFASLRHAKDSELIVKPPVGNHRSIEGETP
jgi:hypothetical protein